MSTTIGAVMTGELVTFPFVGMNNATDPAYLDQSKGECEELLNVDPNNKGGFKTRPGKVSVHADPCHSGWGNGIDSYLVASGILYHFNGTTRTPLVALNSDERVCFAQVNDVVAFWSLTDKGMLQGKTVIPQAAPSGEFKVASPYGQMIAHFGGRLYIASGPDLYCTDAFEPTLNQCDEREYLVFTLDAPITLLAAVDDGLYVGSDPQGKNPQTAFLMGRDPYDGNGFNILYRSGGAVAHTAVTAPAKQLPGLQLSGMCVLFAGDNGVYAGGNSGQLLNLSVNVLHLPAATSGAGLLREENGLIHYLVSLSNVADGNIYQKPAVNAETITV